MRWDGQQLGADTALIGAGELVRTVRTPEFDGITFHEVLAKSALNRVPGTALPFDWTINPYRGCTHACLFCFARRTHEYLDFDAGKDFDTQIVVKVNVGDVLERELAKPGWRRERVALGTNTDPYQRAEGRYQLMPRIIPALAGSGTPFSILTKGTLLRRDLPLLEDAAERVPVDVAMTIDVFDPELQPVLEPGAPSTPARLATVRALADAGIDCTVFVMPIIPYLTDSKAHLDRAFAEIAAAGAIGVAWSALHLKPGAREWFLGWLERDRPDLVGRYRTLYPSGQVYAPAGYRKWLANRVRPLLRAHGLDRPRRSSAPQAELPPATAAALQPTLF